MGRPPPPVPVSVMFLVSQSEPAPEGEPEVGERVRLSEGVLEAIGRRNCPSSLGSNR